MSDCGCERVVANFYGVRCVVPVCWCEGRECPDRPSAPVFDQLMSAPPEPPRRAKARRS